MSHPIDEESERPLLITGPINTSLPTSSTPFKTVTPSKVPTTTPAPTVATTTSTSQPQLSDREIAILQLKNLKDLIDFQGSDDEVDALLAETQINVTTYRSAVRYAHIRLRAQNAILEDLERELDRRELYGRHRGVARDVEDAVGKAQHVGDEEWLLGATIMEMREEVTLAAWERKMKESSAVNLRLIIEANDDDVERRAMGLIRTVGQEAPPGWYDNISERYHSSPETPITRPSAFARGGGRGASWGDLGGPRVASNGWGRGNNRGGNGHRGQNVNGGGTTGHRGRRGGRGRGS